MAIREGRWDCPSCGSTGLLGRDVTCAGCGSPRPQGVRFYLSDDALVVTDAARLAEAKAGPDWVCEHCGGSARATQASCPGCGAPRGSSPTQAVHDYDAAEVPRSGAKPDPAAVPGEKKPEGSAAAGCCGLGCIGLVVVLVLMGLAKACGGGSGADRPRPVAAQPVAGARDSSRLVEHFDPFIRAVVTGHRWTRSVAVEALRRMELTGESVPSDGELVSSSREVTGHRQVLDHYETRSHERSEEVRTGTESYVCGQRDLGNGYFEDRTCTRPVYETRTRTETEREPVYHSEPEYGTVYRYRVWRWETDTTLVAQTTSDTPPPWPHVRARSRRRAGARSEVQEVTLQAGARVFRAPVTPLQYRRLLIGDTIRLVLGEDGTVSNVLPVWRGPLPAAEPSDDSVAADSAPPAKPRAHKSKRRRQRG
jgi:hypothetical protein